MKNFKRIAIASEERIVQSNALILFDGQPGSISTALAKLERSEATALIEAMPEGKIAERLLTLVENINISGTFANPETTSADETESTEDLLQSLQDDIEAIIRYSSEEKFSKVLHHFIAMYLDLVDEVGTTSIRIAVTLGDNEVKSVTMKTADEKYPFASTIKSHLAVLSGNEDADGVDKKSPVLVMNSHTYEQLSQRARTEIINNSQIEERNIHIRHAIDFIKFLLLQKALFAVFQAINTAERFDDIRNTLSIALRVQLEGAKIVHIVDPNTDEVLDTIVTVGPTEHELESGSSLISEAEILSDPDAAREIAHITRTQEEIEEMRREGKLHDKEGDRLRLKLKRDKSAQAWLAEHAGDLTEFDDVDKGLEEGDPDTVSLEEVDGKGRPVKGKKGKKTREPKEPKELEFEE